VVVNGGQELVEFLHGLIARARTCRGRTVGDILLPMLFERFPNMTLPDPASVRWHGFGFRGPLNLPLQLQ